MLFLFSILCFFLAIAEESTTESTDNNEEGLVDEEIIIYGQSEVERRRKLLEKEIIKTGYREGIRRNDKVLYRPEVVWKPTIVVYDSGFVDLRKTPPRFEPWIKGPKTNKWRYLSCIPPFTLMCIKASGWLITKRRAQHSKTKAIENIIDSIQSWQEAIVVVATQRRLQEDIPDFLDELWNGESVLSMQQRKEEILGFWSSRTCTSEGDNAAAVIADFIEMEIQYSKTPVSKKEKQTAEEQSSCQRILNISIDSKE